MDILTLKDKNNVYYKYALEKEIERGEAGNTAPESYPPSLDLHPLINSYRNKKLFNIESDEEMGWFQYLINNFPPSEIGLTLGSGKGRHAKRLKELGFVKKWESIDLLKVKGEYLTDLNVNTSINDLNFIDLPENKYKVIFCQGVLHHIINLEHLLVQINKALCKDGILIVFEFIGEKKWQWQRNKIKYINKKLNERYGFFSKIKVKKQPLYVMNDRPLESIRSSEIPGIINKVFGKNIYYEKQWNPILYVMKTAKIPKKNKKNKQFINDFLNYAIEINEINENSKVFLDTELIGIYYKNEQVEIPPITPLNNVEIKDLLGPKRKPIFYKIKNGLKTIYHKYLQRI